MNTWRQIYVWNIIRGNRRPGERKNGHVVRVYIMLKWLLTGLCTLSLIACASPFVDDTPPLKLEGLVFNNQTRMWVSAVRLLVPLTGNFVSCGNISPESRCATTFPETDYTGNPIEITWSQGGQIYSTGQFVIQLPDDLDPERPAAVQIVITGPGSAGAMIVQRPLEVNQP